MPHRAHVKTEEQAGSAGPAASHRAATSPDRELLHLQGAVGNRVVQAKLELGAVDSPLEAQADEIADQVAGPSAGGPRVDLPGGADDELDPEVSSAIMRSSGGGRPLPGEVRTEMEAGIGADLSGVRVHTGSGADELSRSIKAKAFTSGNDIFFKDGAYDPSSGSGKHLLAHELAHVAQQATVVSRAPDEQQSRASDQQLRARPLPTHTIIIGAGSSAAEYAATSGDAGAMTSIGGEERWSKAPASHAMGQPRHLLQLSGGEIPEYSEEFVPSGEYVERLAELRQARGTKRIDRAAVRKVTKKGPVYEVMLMDGSLLQATKVVVATGAGPARKPPTEDPANEMETDHQKMVSGDEYTDQKVRPPKGGFVAVQGGSATASWAAQKARDAGCEVYWFTRPKESSDPFEGAFPAGDRNVRTQEEFEGRRHQRKLDHAQIVGKRVKLTFNDGEKEFDQFVYAIGAEPKAEGSQPGPGAIIDPELLSQLRVVRDTNSYFYDEAEGVIIGKATDDGSLVVVGPAAFSLLPADDKKQYAAANQTLPPNARPPEGIPTLVANIEALNNYMPPSVTDRVNFNIANRTQLAVYIAANHPDLTSRAAEELVANIVAARSDATFGIGPNEIDALIATAYERDL